VSVDLRAAIPAYLAARRARGHRLAKQEQLLKAFGAHLEACGQRRVTVAVALAFATAPAGTSRAWQAQRLSAVRDFARYIHFLDPTAADLIPAGLLPARRSRRVPYLFTDEETARLMAAAGALRSPVLAASMTTLVGLLAATGMRGGEAGALDVDDVDLDGLVASVTGKYGRRRLVALHPTTGRALAGYLPVRGEHAAPDTTALLLGATGRRLRLNTAREIFRKLADDCGLTPRPGTGAPRLHDFRH